MKSSFSIKQLQVPLGFIIAINLVLKLWIFFAIHPGQNLLNNKIANQNVDELSYDFIAHQIINYKTFAPPADSMYHAEAGAINKPHILQNYHDVLRLPGYPLFIAALYTVFGIKPYLVILVQLLISLLGLTMVYRICMVTSGNKSVASVATLLYAVDIHSIYISCMLLADTFAALTLLISVYYFIKAMQGMGNRNLIFSAIAMAFSCIIRPVALLYPLLLFFLFFLFSHENLLQKLKTCLVYALISCVFISAWSLRNHRVYGHWDLTIESGELLAMWSAAFSEARVSHRNIDSVRAEFQLRADSMGFEHTPNVFDKAAIYQKIGMDYFKQHKGSMLASTIIGGAHMYLSIGNIDIGKSLGWETANIRGYPGMDAQRIAKNFSGGKEMMLAILILLVLFLQYTGALVGIIVLYRKHNYLLLALCILTILYYTGITGIVGMYRYKLPVVPFICILSGYGYWRIFRLKSNLV